MIETILYGPDTVIIGTLLLIYGSFPLFLLWLVFLPSVKPLVAGFHGVTPTFFSAVITMFAFTAAFLGASVWSAFQANNDSVKRERLALLSYIELVDNSPSLQNEGLQSLTKEYIRSALDVEWPLLENEKTSPITQNAFDKLFKKNLEVASKNGSSQIASSLTRSVESLQNARFTRIGFRWHNVETLRWASLILLGLLAQLSTVIIHLDKPRKPMALALTIITTMILLVTTLIALSVDSYSGNITVSKQPLENAYESIK